MAMDTADNILETIQMISEDRLDIRTVTMGISLMDCADSDGERARTRCFDRITAQAARLVEVCEELEAELGIPIINKRISVTPIALVAAASHESDLLPWARMLDDAGKQAGVDFIGGFSALVEKGATSSDQNLISSIPQALAQTDIVCSSVNIGSSRAGINMHAVADMGRAIVETASQSEGGLGAAKLVVFANSVGDNPFMAGAFHGPEMPDCVVSVGVSGPGVINRAIEAVPDAPFDIVAEAVKKAAFKVTRMGELVGNLAAERLGVKFGLGARARAPTAEGGESVAR
ncbi:MAG: DUF711 family protein, partial [Ancrocorticia sp.]|nr:DUF711 family protein [Ancrocorticia sp.]